MEFARSPEEEREREMNKSVAKVAEIITSVEDQAGLDGGCYLLGMAHDAPNTLTVQSDITSLLVLVELIIRKDLKSETSAEDEDGKIVSPFDGC